MAATDGDSESIATRVPSPCPRLLITDRTASAAIEVSRPARVDNTSRAEADLRPRHPIADDGKFLSSALKPHYAEKTPPPAANRGQKPGSPSTTAGLGRADWLNPRIGSITARSDNQHLGIGLRRDAVLEVANIEQSLGFAITPAHGPQILRSMPELFAPRMPIRVGNGSSLPRETNGVSSERRRTSGRRSISIQRVLLPPGLREQDQRAVVGDRESSACTR